MKIRSIETFYCDAGWRPWVFLKVTTDQGLIGWSECSESFGSPRAIEGVVRDLEPHLLGEDPRAYEYIYWKLYRLTRQSPGGVVQKTLAGIENALLDIKAKALGIPVFELFGGPTRNDLRVYWSHCGSTRVRSAEFVGKERIRDLTDIAQLGKEVVQRGYTALKTNLIMPGNPMSVLMQGFRGGPGSSDQNVDVKTLSSIEALMGTFRESVGPEVDICLDLNFHFKSEGNIAIAKLLEPFRLMWLEVDSYNPEALKEVKNATTIPICSGECLYTNRDYRPYFEQHAMSVAAVDVLWNGLAQSRKIADMAEIYDFNVAPHNHYSHLGTFISAHFCATIPNVRILEVDVDDVPWREELTTGVPAIANGRMTLSKKPGWGVDINEKVIQAHPWPKT